MKTEKRPIGLETNLDKILFILATGYLIGVAAWFIRQANLKSNIAANKPPEKSTSVVLESSQEKVEKPPIKFNSDWQKIKLKPESDSPSFPVIEKSLPLPIQPVSDNQTNPPSLPSVISPPPLNLITPPVSSLKPYSSEPIKVPIPPPPSVLPKPKIIQTPPVTSLPVLDSKNTNNNTYSNPLNPSSPVIIPNLNNVLVGLVELEDQSIALFKVNNLDQRVKVGEEIGTSGWILLSVNGRQQQALISRDGQTIRLALGEKF